MTTRNVRSITNNPSCMVSCIEWKKMEKIEKNEQIFFFFSKRQEWEGDLWKHEIGWILLKHQWFAETRHFFQPFFCRARSKVFADPVQMMHSIRILAICFLETILFCSFPECFSAPHVEHNKTNDPSQNNVVKKTAHSSNYQSIGIKNYHV